jgi:hypothetical protein
MGLLWLAVIGLVLFVATAAAFVCPRSTSPLLPLSPLPAGAPAIVKRLTCGNVKRLT